MTSFLPPGPAVPDLGLYTPAHEPTFTPDQHAIPPLSESRVLIIMTGGTICMIPSPTGLIPAPDFLATHLLPRPSFNASSLARPPRLVSYTPDGDAVLTPSLRTPPSRHNRHVLYTVQEFSPLLDSSSVASPGWATIASAIQRNYVFFDGFVVLHGTDSLAYTASALSFMLGEELAKPVVFTGSQAPFSQLHSDAIDNLLGALLLAGHHPVPEVGLFFANALYRGNRATKVSATSFTAFASPNFPPLATVDATGIRVNWHLLRKPREKDQRPGPPPLPSSFSSSAASTITPPSSERSDSDGWSSSTAGVVSSNGNGYPNGDENSHNNDNYYYNNHHSSSSSNGNNSTISTNTHPYRPHRHLEVRPTLDTGHVACLRLFPGITASLLDAVIRVKPIVGLVLETFGAGNAPTGSGGGNDYDDPPHDGIFRVLADAVARDVVVVAVTQCLEGAVGATYQAGRALREIGVVPGGDMTSEAALSKLAWLLAEEGCPASGKDGAQAVRRKMAVSLRGEMS